MPDSFKGDNTDAGDLPVTDAFLRRYIGYRMKRAYVHIHSNAQAAIETFGLRVTTSSALHIIVENPNLSQSQLSLALSIERSRAVLLVDELEKLGLITRNRVPQDRRSYALRATPAGEALLEKVVESLIRHEETLLAGLTAAEKTQLAGLLDKIERRAIDARKAGA
ncbi:MarR family winged helix-turn-helix transcriptional regulator [Roseinatronobacter alkalisoli]|uniref:MarR family transcriptional regulator n=1 Tax=Roseinatronobacter alkalisoli TaxID=3028235 RepID=A0ABT5TBA5_9RHOB|nr:MarR family transcriptional regulator [Roseinatronobacter sp. HJB301]MDD7972398.1 MarR family transcriptional regulator [Roseinatronobacter sp. HJB301]